MLTQRAPSICPYESQLRKHRLPQVLSPNQNAKTTQTIKVRPIQLIKRQRTFTAHLVDVFQSPRAHVQNTPAHLAIENSLELIRWIQDGDLNEKTLPYPCSLRIPIHIHTCPSSLQQRCQQNPTHNTSSLQSKRWRPTQYDTSQHVLHLWRLHIPPNRKPMKGSSISGILAILFMDKLERIALSSHRLFSPYERYVDDTYLQTTNEEKAGELHRTIKTFTLGWNLRSKTPPPDQKAASYLLDFRVTISERQKLRQKANKETNKKQRGSQYFCTISQPYLETQRLTSFVMNEDVIQQRSLHPSEINTTAHLMTSFASTDTRTTS